MILLLEGADCSGKTTLAETLVSALGDRATYVHHTHETNSINEFSRTLNEATDRQSKDKDHWTVIDRLWISEMIYGSLVRDRSRDPDGIVMRLCHMHGVVTIMAVRHDLTRHRNHFLEVAKNREEYAKSKITDVIEAYHDLWYGRSAPSLKFPAMGLYNQLIRFTPLQILRMYFQYDMDKFTPEQYVNWLLRMETAR